MTLSTSLKRVHIVGVGGTLMGAFAAFLKRSGVLVTGSDQAIYPPMSDVLRAAGVETLTNYSAENISAMKELPDLVVIGNVIRSDNPEAQYVKQTGIPYDSLPGFMEHHLLASTQNLVVCGTHGKTTSSSLLAFVLRELEQTPSFFIGGVSHDLPYSFHVEPSNKYFVLEGDEYDTAFWDKVPKFFHYRPDHALLTSIEFDHADIYPDLAAVVRAFDGLFTRIRPGGHIIACVDYAPVRELIARHPQVKVITYGMSGEHSPDYQIENFQDDGGISRFSIKSRSGETTATLELQIPGVYNAANALAVWLECKTLKLDPHAVAAALKKFRGVKRRQEIKGEIRGIRVIDDFAHHPTAVKETLQGIKTRYSGARLIAVFEPRSATSRRKIFQEAYSQAFGVADQIFLAQPYDQSKIAASEQFSSAQLVTDLTQKGRSAHLMTTVNDGVNQVAEIAQPGDIIAVLSNGGFEGFIPKLLDRLQKAK